MVTSPIELKRNIPPIAFGNQTICRAGGKRVTNPSRLTALRPCFAAGLPLSCAIVIILKINSLLDEIQATATALSKFKTSLSSFIFMSRSVSDA
jgi:hypothetical protein